jgi:hypothetical protein
MESVHKSRIRNFLLAHNCCGVYAGRNVFPCCNALLTDSRTSNNCYHFSREIGPFMASKLVCAENCAF